MMRLRLIFHVQETVLESERWVFRLSWYVLQSHHKAQQDIKIHQRRSRCIEMKSLEQWAKAIPAESNSLVSLCAIYRRQAQISLWSVILNINWDQIMREGGELQGGVDRHESRVIDLSAEGRVSDLSLESEKNTVCLPRVYKALGSTMKRSFSHKL